MAQFTVDTHLFRELGALLVGRDSTALIELIKNAYDADATEVVVYAEALDDLDRAYIQVTDDGVGMSQEEFTAGFLRVASRLKNTPDRRSVHLQRRYTGAKGIGRLAAHKLASLLEVESMSSERNESAERLLLTARIDWDRVEEADTLDSVAADAISLDTHQPRSGHEAGTTIRLRRLRRRWSEAERSRFLAEVQGFEAPSLLTDGLSRSVAAGPLIFVDPVVKDSHGSGDTFSVRLEGDFSAGDELWHAVGEAASWIVEIRASRGNGIKYVVAPTQRTLRDNPAAQRVEFEQDHVDPSDGPFFDARILIREGSGGSASSRVWMNRAAGIRVYMEGFRVLPYGETGNDWLSIDADYTRRRRKLQFLDDDAEASPDEGLSTLPNVNYFGGVYLTEANAPSLRMLVNREGFVPEAGWEHVVEIVRRGVNLATRARAAARSAAQSPKPSRRVDRGDKVLTPREGLARALERARQHADRASESAAAGDLKGTRLALDLFRGELTEVEQRSDEYISELAMTRVLASLGTQMAAFVHEMNALVSMASDLAAVFEDRMADLKLSRNERGELSRIGSALGDLKRTLEREASYLVDVVTVDARRRRSRQKLRLALETAISLVRSSAERRDVAILNELPDDLRSPPMFRAEIVSILTNLLTNAVKGAGTSGQVRVRGSSTADAGSSITIDNTGEAVEPEAGEKWFRPFESTTVTVDPVLGHGMGMGLPITRRILEEYGSAVSFVSPPDGYATAVEVRFP